jgi:hypothetical protein
VSYLNFPRRGCPRGKKICVWTHLGLIKWKMTSKKIKNGRKLFKKNGRRPQKKKKKKNYQKKTRSTQKKKEDDLKKKEDYLKTWKTT